MNPAALIPAEISINAAIAICAVAFVSGRRGDFPVRLALIFMPLALDRRPRWSRLLLIIDFALRRCCPARGKRPTARRLRSWCSAR
jgi:hypothetical protein